MRENRKVDRVSFSLEDEYKDLLEQIVVITRRKKTEELRVLIDSQAVALGLEPIRPVVKPKKQP